MNIAVMHIAVVLAYVGAGCGGAVALIAVLRGWRSLAGWFFVAGMALLALESALLGLGTDAVIREEAQRWHLWQMMVMSLLPGVWLVFSFTYARGNYREFLRRWRIFLVLAFLLPVCLAALAPQNLLLTPMSAQSAGVPEMNENGEWIFQLGAAGKGLYTLCLLGMLLVLMNLERTFRATIGTMRWRVKFMILGLGVLFVVRCYTVSQALLWPARGMDSSLVSVASAALSLGCLLILRSLFRDVSEVSVFPPKSILENSLIAVVAGIYLVCVGILAKLAAWIHNAGSFQFKAFFLLVSMVGVTVLALSDRVQMRTRRFLSRYFQRPLYDYRLVWRSLTEGTASRVNQGDICQSAVALMSQIFQALSVTIWLVDEKKEGLVFAASTALSSAHAAGLQPSKEEALDLFGALQNHSDPVDIEIAREAWAAVLRRCNPSQFRTGGNRVCVPLMATGHVLGVIVLGDRVSGIYFSLQDFDLLRCVGDQVAAGLLNSQLSQKLLQAKELEAFQTMSAFFVHDLKNTASTLNLMLQNLPAHFDNPAFREDALRGVSKTCDHINNLIGRLSLLRHDLQIKAAEADLNDVIAGVLSTWPGAKGVTVVKDLQSCPKVLLDQEQIVKVVTNLVINAGEALQRGGEIRVGTSQRNGWAVLSVADNGCGMTPDFLHRALFRPFQTTKKKGFGIGMFQSKMIVEAHGGRIEVESELNKGTTFRVLLPISRQTK